ncbi:8902_t:CDS:2, partial [Gigaspora rosea]
LKQLKEELRDVKNKLNKLEPLEQESDAGLDLHSQNLLMKTEIVQKDTEIDNLTRKVADLNLVNEERIKLINDLEAQIAKLTSDIEILRSNCKMINAESIQNATKLYDAESKIADEKRKYNSFVAKHERELRSRDERESDLYSHITLLKNRIKDLESMLVIKKRAPQRIDIFSLKKLDPMVEKLADATISLTSLDLSYNDFENYVSNFSS